MFIFYIFKNWFYLVGLSYKGFVNCFFFLDVKTSQLKLKKQLILSLKFLSFIYSGTNLTKQRPTCKN